MVDNICMTADEKALAQAYLPVSDEGGMRFPRRKFFPFLKEFDTIVRSEINYKAFEKHGNKLFQVHAYYVHDIVHNHVCTIDYRATYVYVSGSIIYASTVVHLITHYFYVGDCPPDANT